MLERSEAVGVVAASRSFLAEHGLPVDIGDTLHPAGVGLDRPVEPDSVLHDHVPGRAHRSLWQREAPYRVPLPAFVPFLPPAPQGRAQVLQALEGEEIRGERDHHVLGGDQHRPVQRAQGWPHVDQDQPRLSLLGSPLQDPPHRADHPERAWLAVEAVRPLAGELVLGRGQGQVAGDQTQAWADLLHMGVSHVTGPVQERHQRLVDRPSRPSVGPELLDTVLLQEHAGQVGLRIEVGGDHRDPLIGIHPGQVIDQRGLSDPSLVVEEGDRLHRAGLRIAIT